MSTQYEVLFLFSSPQGHLAEVKRLDLPENTPKARMYQWLWMQETAIVAFRFVNMAHCPRQQRTFEEGWLWFDDQRGELSLASGQIVQLVAEVEKALPPALMQQVNLHFS